MRHRSIRNLFRPRRNTPRRHAAPPARRPRLALEQLEPRNLPSFLAPASYASNPYPTGMATGDFNHDGIADLVVTNDQSAQVSVLLGNGDGSFRPPVSYPTDNAPNDVAVADFNGDGHLDLAVANRGASTVTILLGNGDGTFRPAINLDVGGPCYTVAAADLNGDGIPDLAVTTYNSNSVTVLLGNGNGTFRSPASYPAGPTPYKVAVGDFNRDGHPDLAVTNFTTAGSVRILLGDGHGAFATPVTYATGPSAQGLAVADLNGDGKLDLAVANFQSTTMSVLLANGDGTFQPAVNYAAGSSPTSVVAADFNRDGVPDLAVANYTANTVSVFLDNGDGTFRSPVTYAAGPVPRWLAVADYNGDGFPDLAVTNNLSTTVSVLKNAADWNGLAVPGPQTVAANGTLILSTAGGNPITVSNGGNANETVWLQVSAGRLRVVSTAGLSSVYGNDTSLLGLTGTPGAINTALQTLTYRPNGAADQDELDVLLVPGGQGNVSAHVPIAVAATPVVDGPRVQYAGGTGLVTLSAANGNAITIADPFDPFTGETVLVQALSGSLFATLTGGLGSVRGNGTNRLTLMGPVPALNTALYGLMYQAPAGITSDYLNVEIVSPQGTGLLGTAITVEGTADVRPQVSAPAQQRAKLAGVVFDTVNGNAVQVSDGDANAATETLYLQTFSGTLNVANSQATVTHRSPQSLVVTGTIDQLNQALEGLTYFPASGATADELDVLISDGIKSSSAAVALPIITGDSNLAPTISVPAAQAVGAGAVLTFAEGTSNAITVADGDSDGGIETVYLQSLSGGRLTVSNTQFLTSTVGNGTSSLALAGAVAALDVALDGLQYTAPAGAASDWLSVLVNDNGNSGGPAQAASAGVGIRIAG